MSSLVGQTVSHYTILEHLGGGGMGVVYKARDLRLDRSVALKFLPRELTFDPDAKRRFIQEAKAASALQHDNICVVHDIEEGPDLRLFIVLEYYEGETLKKRLGRGAFPVEEAIRVATEVGEGLAEAHRHGIVHRDIKPANIMLTRQDCVKVVDFGIAMLLGAARATGEGKRVGTMEYMSPEQVRGDQVDHRTDIWALGVLLYEMVSGRNPFQSTYDEALLYSILSTEPPSLSTIDPAVPERLDQIVARALAKDPAGRYQRVEEMLEDLRNVNAPREERSRRSMRRFLWPVVALGVLAAGAVVLSTLLRPAGPDRNAGEKLRVAILPVQNLTRRPEVDSWATRIQESALPAEIVSTEWIALLSPSAIAPVGGTLPPGADGEARTELYRAATGAGAQYLMEGSILPGDTSSYLQVNLVDPGSTSLLYTARTELNGTSDIAKAVSIVARQILFYLDMEVVHPDRDLKPWIPARITDVDAKREFIQGATIMFTGELGGGAYLDRALRRDSTFIAPRIWRMPSMVYSGRGAEAEADLQALLRLEPLATPFERSMIEYAKGLIRRDQHVMSRGLERALLFTPGNRIVLINLGWVYYEMGDFDGALRVLQPVVSSRMPYPPVYPQFAHALLKAGRFAEARDVLATALTMRPVEPDTYCISAAFAWSDGDSIAAEKYEGLFTDRMKDFVAGWEDVDLNIGKALLDLQSYPLAEQFLRNAASVDPGSPEPLTYLAETLLAMGDTVGAEVEATRALVADPGSPKAHEILGGINDHRGEWAGAAEHYRKYLDRDSLSVPASHIQRRLSLLTKKTR